jgi:NADH dehydrogenase (ubiquinone) Fe-S protein 6
MAAIELIKQVPIQIVHQRIISCDGGWLMLTDRIGDGDLGHPKVYINLVSF